MSLSIKLKQNTILHVEFENSLIRVGLFLLQLRSNWCQLRIDSLDDWAFSFAMLWYVVEKRDKRLRFACRPACFVVAYSIGNYALYLCIEHYFKETGIETS